MKLFYTIGFIIFYLSLFSQTKITVEKSDYKNEQLIFYAYSDYITSLKDSIAVVRTDENGAFTISVNIQNSKQIFIDLGVYHCSFYAEQNKNYQLSLPQKRLKTKAEELNIYFEPIELSLALTHTPLRDLNRLIASFDDIYEEFLSKNFDSIYHSPNPKLIDKFEKDINKFYSEINHPFFRTYRKYKINELRFLGPNRSFETITFYYYNQKAISYTNPAYMHLFNLMYKDFFNVYGNTPDGEGLQIAVKEGRTVKRIINILDQNAAFSDKNLEEFVLLKGIHDELFNSRTSNQIHFPKPQMKIILDSIAEFSPIYQHRLIASNILKKYKKEDSIIGKSLPNFKFKSITGTEKSLDDFKGKYVYLNFMRTDVVPAMESMDRLINFYKNHKIDIEIVTIFMDQDSSNFYKLDTVKYNWNLLYSEDNKQILNFFKLITWPQFYLISKEGKIIMSPAPSIKEDFEIKFFDWMDSKK